MEAVRFHHLHPAVQFAGLGARSHIDWNIKNFVFDEAAGQLYYVDLKPTIFVARQSNGQNLEGIRRYYLV